MTEATTTPAATAAPAASTTSAAAPAVTTTPAATAAPAASTNSAALAALTGGEDPMLAFPEKYLTDGKHDEAKLVKGYNELSKMLGDKNLLPPDSADGYKFEGDLLTSIEWDQPKLKELFTEAHKHGMTNKQVNFVMDKWANSVINAIPQPEQIEADLKQTWGKDFDVNLNNAFKAVETFLGPEADLSGIQGNIPVLRLLAKIGKDLGETTNDLPAGGASAITAEQALELRNRPDRWTNQDVIRQLKQYSEQKAAKQV